MTEKFHNKYRIASARLQHWNYGWNAAYFVTICTKNRECFFGEIIVETPQPQMQFSPIGQIANEYWMEIPKHFPFVKLGDHIVMPNHVHGIVIIDKQGDVETHDFASTTETHDYASLRTNTFGPQSKNLASIMRGYKSAVKKYATINNINFAWQARFHDHIIRDDQSFQNISAYITNNPLNWKTDEWYL
jgi:putative transposase